MAQSFMVWGGGWWTPHSKSVYWQGGEGRHTNSLNSGPIEGDTTHQNLITCSYWGGDTAHFQTLAVGRVGGWIGCGGYVLGGWIGCGGYVVAGIF